MPAKEEVCNADAVRAAVHKVAAGIISEFLSGSTVNEFALIGIHQQGVPLAGRLLSVIKAETGYTPEFALLDISMYRDDIGVRQDLPRIYETRIPFDMNDKAV
ncbi:MAG: hypothetical protein PHV59_08955, partial [Victivallales bacterium]|nr:hypothetical protein [Victivallales bacterium]